MKYTTRNKLDIYKDLYDKIPVTTQLTDVLMKSALLMKDSNVSLAIECYDVIHYKLLRINIFNSI